MIQGIKALPGRTELAAVAAPKPSSFGKVISARHKSVCRMLGFSLLADTSESWSSCSRLLGLRLEQGELVSIALAVLCALKPGPLQTVLDLVNWGESEGSRAPLPSCGNTLDDARWWASGASLQTLKIFLLVCFKALPLTERAAFLHFVTTEDI